LASTDEALAEVARRRFFVTNLYEGRDGIWRAFLRSKRADAACVARGEGQTAAAAIISALRAKDLDDLIG